MVDLRNFENLHAVQAIAALVRGWWKLELAFADANGYVLDHADGNIFPSGNAFCKKALHSKEGFRRCNESVKAMGDRLRSLQPARSLQPTQSGRASVVRRCHLGFDLVAAPIHFAGELQGFVFVGGALHQEPKAQQKSELFSSLREFSEGAHEELESGFVAVPRMSEKELEHLSSMLEYAAAEAMKVQALAEGRAQVAVHDASTVQTRFGDIVGASPSMIEMFELLEKVVKSEATVLVHGESGTGKELIARAIHFHGPRAKKPFVVQNCSAFNDNLLESALFGHVRGSFTGAVKDQKGLFETANGGTFFLDEIGDMSPALQVKLLRVLQEGVLTPVGATKPVRVDVRIVAASHKNLTELVKTGQFREDLYYRVNVLRISVPPLRERLEDLPMLVSHFLRKHHHGEGEAPVLAADTMAVLANYQWPGNIRELENEMERINVLAVGDEPIAPSMLSSRLVEAMPACESSTAPKPISVGDVAPGTTLREMVEGMESEVIHQGLIRTHWNKSQLAKELGISRSNLIQKCSYYGLERKK